MNFLDGKQKETEQEEQEKVIERLKGFKELKEFEMFLESETMKLTEYFEKNGYPVELSQIITCRFLGMMGMSDLQEFMKNKKEEETLSDLQV